MRILIYLLSVLVGLYHTPVVAQSVDVEMQAQSLLKAGAAGFSMALVDKDGIYWSESYGFADIEAQRPMSIDSVMNIASISKTVTGTSLMLLVEQGKLDLDADVNDYLPFKVQNPRFPESAITARQLLTHTSSIVDRGELYSSEVVYFPGADNPLGLGDFVREYLSESGEYFEQGNFADYSPGARYEYSNIAYGLAGYLVEVLSGQPLNSFSADKIFGPLEMRSTGWLLTEIDTDRHASLYEWGDDGHVQVDWYGLATWPDGGVRTSVRDLSRFVAAMISDGELGGERIIDSQSLAMMFQPQFVRGQVLESVPEEDGHQQAISWAYTSRYADRMVVGHSGGDPGVRTYAFFDPVTGRGAILFVNTTSRDDEFNRAAHGMFRTLLSAAMEDDANASVYTITEKPTAYQEADRLGIWFPASDFEPLGLYLEPGQPLAVDVRSIEGNTRPKLLVGTYSRYKYGDVPTVYDLVAGPNTITDSKGGLLYLQFVTEGSPTGVAEVTIDGGSPVPFFVLGESTREEWQHQLDSMTYDNVQFVSEKTVVVVSKETALEYRDEDQDLMLKTLDKAWEIEDYISGIDGSSDLHKPNVHKILITELTEEDLDFSLAAEEYRIIVPTKSLRNIMDPEFASTAAWGLWHEMGHHHQALNWDWNEVDEVTVNIYSLACLYGFDGTISWLKGNEVWDVLAEYFESPIDKRDFNNDSTIGGKGRLAMFRQLWMAFGDEFYIQVHKLAREDNAKPEPRVEPRYGSTGDEQMAHFMLLASEASGYNLKEFFTQWGFKLPQDDFDALDALNLPEPEIDLISLRE